LRKLANAEATALFQAQRINRTIPKTKPPLVVPEISSAAHTT
jgi:hypothetical protein